VTTRLAATSPTPRIRVPRHVAGHVARLVTRLVGVRVPRHVARLVVDHFAYAARPGASARRAACRRLLRLRRASGCLATSRGLSSTISPTPRVPVPRHVARLVVDYFDYTGRLGASTRHAARRAARRRLLRLRRASGCLGTSHGTSRGSSSTTLTTRVSGCFGTSRARRRLLRLRHASGCLGTSRGSSRGSSRRSSSTSTTPHVRVPRHVARLVTRLVAPLIVDFFAYTVRPSASARRAACRRLLRLRRASGCLGTSRGSSSTTSCAATSSCGHTGSTSATPCVVTTCLEYVACCRDVVFWSHRVDHSSRLVWISTSFPN
jgi:hypothetical protein